MSHLTVGAILLAASTCLNGAATGEDFRPYTEAPRLLLRSQRLRLLKRERERQSPRWERFATFATGAAAVPEPGLAHALYYVVSGDTEAGRRAVEWALRPGADTRQVALVFDWCKPLLTPAESQSFVVRLRETARNPGERTLASARTRAFAAIAIAFEEPAASESTLRNIIENWWRKEFAPAIRSGRLPISPSDNQAVFELMHVVIDNLKIDLREDAPDWFRTLPEWQVLAHYPAPYNGPENDYFIPAYAGTGPPDLAAAARSRIAGLSMVAYDTNSQQAQFLQGWLMMDRFVLRSPFGSPYEFLWANPYLPGLSYHHMSSLFHDPESGRLALRSTWDEDALWLGYAGNELQQFSDGKATILARGRSHEPFNVGPYRVMFGEPSGSLKLAAGEFQAVVLLGLTPSAEYTLRSGTERPAVIKADPHGTIVYHPPTDVEVTLRLTRAAAKGTSR